MSNTKLVILGQEVKKGSSLLLEMEIAKLHTRNHISVPIIIERSVKDGPVLLLVGGVHGDETNGVAIIREIIRKKYNKPKCGTVICIPVFNVFGYLNHSREFPDGRDLNRMFPGTENGSLASQFAYKFTTEIAPHVDYVIDFHTGAAARENYPNIRYSKENGINFQLAKVFDVPFIVHSNHIAKSLRETVHKIGKPVLLFEGGKSMQLDPTVIKIGVEGTVNIMRYLKMQNGVPQSKNKPVIIHKNKWLRAPFSGIFEPSVKNGSYIKKKSIIGRISDPYGEFEKKIVAQHDAYIFGINTSPTVNKGDAIFHISTECD